MSRTKIEHQVVALRAALTAAAKAVVTTADEARAFADRLVALVERARTVAADAAATAESYSVAHTEAHARLRGTNAALIAAAYDDVDDDAYDAAAAAAAAAEAAAGDALERVAITALDRDAALEVLDEASRYADAATCYAATCGAA